MDILLGFHFYGTGNIGDDIMLQGFIDIASEIKNLQFSCVIDNNNRIKTLRKRFPSIKWLPESKYSEYDAWLGMGDTPIQTSSGLWFYNYLKKEIEKVKKYNLPMYMVGIGAEEEVLDRNIYNKIIRNFNLISTRDIATNAILKKLSYPDDRIVSGSDLANYILKDIFSETEVIEEREIDLGFTVNMGDGLSLMDILKSSLFIKKLHSKKYNISFIANEVRNNRNFESSVYNRYFKPLYILSRKKVDLIVPDYYSSDNVSTLVKHYGKIKCVISSRYHGVLTAAWAGSRVGGIVRSSKVMNLAKELDIPYIEPPITIQKLDFLLENCKVVDKEKLELLHLQSKEATKKLLIHLCESC